jgi:putative phosphoesterase
MRVGIVSDTHGHIKNTLDAARLLESLEVSQLIHCGDIGTPEIVPLLSSWRTHYVFGNVDYDRPSLRDAIHQAGQRCHERFGELGIAGIRIAWLHGDDTRRFQETVSGGEWDVVCYGHTHVAEHHFEGETLVLNPGAVYRATFHSLAVLDLPSREVNIVRF